MLSSLKKFTQLTIKMRFIAIAASLILGFSAFGFPTFQAIHTLTVNGPIYQRIEQGKDIIADVLPPPEYIIESYLVALQLGQATTPDEINTLTESFQSLKKEYESRHRYWQGQSLQPNLHAALLQDSHQAAQAFYHEAEQRFLPSIQAGDHARSQASLQQMRHAYEQHRSAINEVVRLATARNADDEAQAQGTILWYKIVLTGIFVVSIVVAIALTALISRSILRSLKTAQQVAGAIAGGNLNSRIDIQQHDEIGDLLRSMNTMQGSINTFVTDLDIMAKKHAGGWVKEQIDASKFSGIFGKMAHEINELIQSRIAVNRRLISIVNQYAKGDFSVDMDILPGETVAITEIMDNAKKTFLAVNSEIKMLIEAGAQGDFSKRSDPDKFEFMYKDMLSDLNSLMATCDIGFNDVLHVADALAKGDLTQTIDKSYPGTFGEVIVGMNSIVGNLKVLVGNIKDSTDSINTASKEIAAGNNDLSHRTEQQAASLQQTAASMEQLTSAVQHNAQNAQEANRLAIEASDIAGQGVAAVAQVVATMAGINEASRKIGDIIAVIDEIAFQTNILALNAAVEAARAGEQGRGFAVVAVEVRNLAQRASTAAGEIKELITDSVDKVADGSELVAQAGQTMQQILGAVHGVTDMLTKITAASTEQSVGIEQVNQAITQMDDVTQQNASLVEQAAAAAVLLEEQAQALVVTVSGFKVASNADNFFHSTPAIKTITPLETTADEHLQLQPVDDNDWEVF